MKHILCRRYRLSDIRGLSWHRVIRSKAGPRFGKGFIALVVFSGPCPATSVGMMRPSNRCRQGGACTVGACLNPAGPMPGARQCACWDRVEIVGPAR